MDGQLVLVVGALPLEWVGWLIVILNGPLLPGGAVISAPLPLLSSKMSKCIWYYLYHMCKSAFNGVQLFNGFDSCREWGEGGGTTGMCDKYDTSSKSLKCSFI